MNLYVGNLSYSTTERDLTEAFEQYGEVTSARIITDRETGKNRGFAFVEMDSKGSGMAAIENLNQKELDGRRLVVNEAKPK
ncbi:MAG TPA: RNA-binding protein, partial [Phycisphaerales bacterium]|nr:RNA-binding protein [Phycisphaerales bacterium]